MEGFKRIDYFKKVNSQYSKSTWIGGLLSVLAVLLMAVLLVEEIWYFSISPTTRKEVQINSDYDLNPEIELEFSLLFERAPCSLITVSLRQRNIVSPVRSITKSRIDKNSRKKLQSGYFGKSVAVQPFLDKLTGMEKEILAGMLDRQLCLVEGKVSAERVPGSLHFSLTGAPTIDKLKKLSKWVKPVTLKHEVNYFYVGSDSKDLRRMDRKYGGQGSAPFDRSSEMVFQNDSAEVALLYSYYLEIVPHVYKVHGRDKKGKIGYKYSLSQKTKSLGEGERVETRFQYKISPLTMIHEGQSSTFSQFLIHLCAIMGGSFVVIGMLNRLLTLGFKS